MQDTQNPNHVWSDAIVDDVLLNAIDSYTGSELAPVWTEFGVMCKNVKRRKDFALVVRSLGRAPLAFRAIKDVSDVFSGGYS